jgi:hypothetical protein
VSGTGRLISASLLVLLPLASGWPAANFEPPEWAYPSTPRDFKPDPDDGKPKQLLGSTRAYTYSQIEDSFAPADWYPTEHPKMPEVPVARIVGRHLDHGRRHARDDARRDQSGDRDGAKDAHRRRRPAAHVRAGRLS